MSNGNDTQQQQRIEAVKSALEWSKQILTLATGTLVLSGTFIKDVFKANVVYQNWILASWISMGVSILFGILFLGAMVNILSTESGNDVDVNKRSGIALLHVVPFLIGLLCFGVFVYANLNNINPSQTPNANVTASPSPAPVKTPN